MYNLLIIKRKIEDILLLPFIVIGWLVSKLSKRSNYSIYFFFPFYHIGGAEKIHFQIARAFKGQKCIVYFTRKSIGNSLKEEFKSAGFTMKDISRYTDNKLLYPLNFIYRGIISGKINNQVVAPFIFNGQSNFGYKISPWISKHIIQLDLIHALNTFSKIRIPYLEFYKKSITVSKEIIEKHKKLYDRYKVPRQISNNIIYINYGIDLPVKREKFLNETELNVLYVGRGSEEKRIHLIAEMAETVNRIDSSIRFNFIGDVDEFLPKQLKRYCNLYGSITSEEKIDELYRKNDVLIISSITESGPLVALEAMARGLTIISTPVGIINEHIRHGKNGFIFSTTTDEPIIVKEGIDFILFLRNNVELRKTIAKTNLDYAYANFGIEKFQKAYRNFFKELKTSN
jgi:L-malate glycosyltransferase